jgi:hypothetical protein
MQDRPIFGQAPRFSQEKDAARGGIPGNASTAIFTKSHRKRPLERNPMLYRMPKLARKWAIRDGLIVVLPEKKREAIKRPALETGRN